MTRRMKLTSAREVAIDYPERDEITGHLANGKRWEASATQEPGARGWWTWSVRVDGKFVRSGLTRSKDVQDAWREAKALACEVEGCGVEQ